MRNQGDVGKNPASAGIKGRQFLPEPSPQNVQRLVKIPRGIAGTRQEYPGEYWLGTRQNLIEHFRIPVALPSQHQLSRFFLVKSIYRAASLASGFDSVPSVSDHDYAIQVSLRLCYVKHCTSEVTSCKGKVPMQRMPRTRLLKGQARGEFPWTVLSIFMAGQLIASNWL
jgi:hypothetical protein